MIRIIRSIGLTVDLLSLTSDGPYAKCKEFQIAAIKGLTARTERLDLFIDNIDLHFKRRPLRNECQLI